MLAARMPTATSRMDLSSCSSDYQRQSHTSTVGETGTLRRRGNHVKGLSHASAELYAHRRKLLKRAELIGFAAVCFTYALGQSLYDMFQSSQVKASTASWSAGGHSAYAVSVSAYSLAKVVSSPYVGHMSDRFGRRKVTCLALLCTGLCWQLCGLVSSFWPVLACRLAMGCVATGGLLTARATDVAVDHAQRTRLFSVFTTAWAGARIIAAIVIKLSQADVHRACRAASFCGYFSSILACVAFGATPCPQNQRSRCEQARRCARMGGPARKHKKPSFRSLAREMLSERLAFLLFVNALLTPRVDAAAFVSKQFSAGPDAVGSLKAVEAVAVVTVSLFDGARFFGETSSTAACAAVLVSLGWLGVATAPSLAALYPLVLVRGLFAAVYDPVARSIVFARAERDEHSGSFVGLQQSLKGATQVSSAWLGAYLTSLDVSAPLAVSAVCSLANAAAFALDAANHGRRTRVPAELVNPPSAPYQLTHQDEVNWRAWMWHVEGCARGELLGPREKRLWLVCRCETLRDEEDGLSLALLLRSLRHHMLPASETDLYEATDRKLPRLLCRAMLLALRKAMRGAAEVEDDDDGLSAKGRVEALKLRAYNADPELCLVSPDRASLQTAMLALSGKPNAADLRFVAHDAARPKLLRTNSGALRLEFSPNVDFGSCHDDHKLSTEMPVTFDRRVAALLGFLKHRPEQRIALVAHRDVLDALLRQAAAKPDLDARVIPRRVRLFKLAFTSHDNLDELSDVYADCCRAKCRAHAHNESTSHNTVTHKRCLLDTFVRQPPSFNS